MVMNADCSPAVQKRASGSTLIHYKTWLSDTYLLAEFMIRANNTERENKQTKANNKNKRWAGSDKFIGRHMRQWSRQWSRVASRSYWMVWLCWTHCVRRLTEREGERDRWNVRDFYLAVCSIEGLDHAYLKGWSWCQLQAATEKSLRVER